MLNITRHFMNPAFIRMMIRNHRLLKRDPRCSIRSLFSAARQAVGEDRVVRHEGRLVYSSFLPPIPSRAAEQAMLATDDAEGLFEGFVTGKRRAPISMYVAVTQRCNYACAHCSAAGRHPQREMTTEELKRLFSDLQQMGTSIIGLTGGEPLLREDLLELVASIDERSASFLFTSGFGLDAQKARELKKAGLFAAGISLDSADPAAMDAMRRHPGAYAHAVAAVRHCRAAGIYTMTQTVADRDSLASGRLAEVVALSQEIGAQEVRILETMPSGRMTSIAPEQILTPRERAALCRFHAEMNKKRKGVKVSVFAHAESSERFGCGAGTQHSYIDAAGNLYPCDFVPLAFGNVLEIPVSDLWLDMHRRIGKPRSTCMIMEIYARKVLDGAAEFPLPPEESASCIDRLEPVAALPGFYRRALGQTV